jgi:hypothetical protein
MNCAMTYECAVLAPHPHPSLPLEGEGEKHSAPAPPVLILPFKGRTEVGMGCIAVQWHNYFFARPFAAAFSTLISSIASSMQVTP